jgi:hypothetical protein
MADAASTPLFAQVKTDDGFVVVSKETVTGVATGVKFSMGPIKPDSMSIQLTGSFGSATALLEGSNDGTTFVTCYLEREQTTAGKQDAASFTAAGAGKVMDDAYRYYRVSTSGGTATDIDVTVVARRA